MRFAPLVIGALGLAVGLFAFVSPANQVVILGGDTQGYLSPCGCTSPMIGGIRRKATAIRSLSVPGATTILENGGLVEGAGRQDQLKAETIAQALETLGVRAINIGPSDAKLGANEVAQVSQLAGDRLVSLSFVGREDLNVNSSLSSGPFLIGGVTDAPVETASALGARPVRIEDAAKRLVDEAAEQNLIPVLMLQGSRATAAKLAALNPTLALIQYSSVGDPPRVLEYVGSTALATSGEHGKHIIRLVFDGSKFGGYQSVALGPELRDDPAVSRYYATYLKRVSGERLIDKLARAGTPSYAGSWSCARCHARATHTWKLSAHRHAFETIENLGHAADPDCVGCHVVGLTSTRGFRSMVSTPLLAQVGCESCHGPALAHARDPKTFRAGKATAKTCVTCHNGSNSPNFEFNAYWPRIRH